MENDNKKNNNKKKRILRSSLTRKYRLTIHNESKYDNAFGFYVSPLWVILSLFFSLLLVIGVVYLILVFTPVVEYLPGYAGDRTREKLVNYALTIDSLKNEVDKQGRYISNVKAIFEGRIETGIDTTAKGDTLPYTYATDYPIDATPLEQEFAKEYEEYERYNLISHASNVGTLQGISFHRPTRGMLIKHFNPKEGHYGVDIAENPNESVLAIWDGTVIMSDYTANDGYTIALQHNEELVSVYRSCYRLLKKVGDKVTAGDVIAILGSDDAIEENKESDNAKSDETHSKPYLHLELWHRGEALDPNIYIAF